MSTLKNCYAYMVKCRIGIPNANLPLGKYGHFCRIGGVGIG